MGGGFSAHGKVFKSLCGCGVTEVAKLGEKIKNLHGWRRKADYDLRNTLVEKNVNVQRLLLDATEITNNLEEICLNSSEKDQIKAGILRYLKENT